MKGSWYLLLRQVVSQVCEPGRCMWNTSEAYSPTIPVPSALIFGLMSLSGSSPHTRGELGAGWAAPPYWGAGQSMAGSGPARAVRAAGMWLVSPSLILLALRSSQAVCNPDWRTGYSTFYCLLYFLSALFLASWQPSSLYPFHREVPPS